MPTRNAPTVLSMISMGHMFLIRWYHNVHWCVRCVRCVRALCECAARACWQLRAVAVEAEARYVHVKNIWVLTWVVRARAEMAYLSSLTAYVALRPEIWEALSSAADLPPESLPSR